jgi:transporter family-2 protein
VNGELARQLGDGFVAAIISFGSGLVILAIAVVASPAGRRGMSKFRAAIADGSLPWWHALGGSVGALFVLSQGLAVGLVGVALFTIAVVAGQTISGLFIDRRGIGNVAPKPLSTGRLVGSALAFVSVVLAVSVDVASATQIWLLVLPFVAGLGMGWQQAVNGEVRAATGSPMLATFTNFLVGATVLAVLAVVHLVIVGLPSSYPTAPWLYLGGIIGVLFIAGAAIVVGPLGVLLLGLCSISGQLITSLVLDIVAPTPGHALTITTVIGTVLTLVAVGVAAIPSRRPSQRPSQRSS